MASLKITSAAVCSVWHMDGEDAAPAAGPDLLLALEWAPHCCPRPAWLLLGRLPVGLVRALQPLWLSC